MTRSVTGGAIAACMGLVAATAIPVQVRADDSGFGFTGGAEFSSGKYGGQESIEELYVPATFTYYTRRMSIRVTVPYLNVRAPTETLVDGPDGQPTVEEGPVTTQEGLGDVVGSLTIYDVLTLAGGDVALDLTGEVKFGTADEAKGLGTGKNDYAIQADLYRFFDRLTIIGSAGYLFRGDPEGTPLDDSFFASAGGAYAVTSRVRAGLFYDYCEASAPGSDALQGLTATISARTGERWYTYGYLSTGFGDGSPDWSVGISLSAGF